jgi:hypothetical protein
LQLSREHLLAAATEPEHPRYWRPQILAFSDNPQRRAQLLRFASWIEGGSGLTTAVRIVEGEGLKMRKVKAEAEAELQQDIQKEGIKSDPDGADSDTLAVAEKEAAEAQKQAAKMTRKAVKATAKAEAAAREAEASGVLPEEPKEE